MPSRNMLNAKYDTTRRAVKARSQLRTAVLGDDNQNIYSDRVGFYFARPVLSADENGNGLLGPTFYLRANPAASILPKPGRKIKYKKDDDGLYVIVQADWDDLVQSGVDPIALEPNDPYQANRNLFEIVNLNSYSVGSSLLVCVYPWQYHTADNTVRLYGGTTASTQVDLTSYRPASVDTHCYALLVFNVTAHIANTNPLAVYASTPISAFTALTIASDLQDCYNQLPTTDIIIPIKAYYLQYGQTTIAGISKDLDVRQFINVPDIGLMKSFTVAGDSGTNPVIGDGETLNFHGTGGVTITGDSVTKKITIDGSSISGGITQLTGDVTAGPGSGSRVATLATVNSNVGVFTDATVTVNEKGLITSVSSGTAPINPPFVDTNALIKGSVDATKLIRFEVDGNTTGTTRVYTPPNYNATLSPGTTKGDLSVFNGSDNVRFPVPASTSGRTILTDTSTSTGLLYDYTEIEIDVTWGSSGVTNGKIVYQSESTGYWDLLSPTIGNVGRLKGVVVDQGSSTALNPGRVRVMGNYRTGLFLSFGPVYASNTAGGQTTAEPSPTLNGGTIIIAQMGTVQDGLTTLINGFMAPIYRTWLTLANAGVTSITHMKNRPSLTRTVNIRSVVYDVAVAETYAPSNQDSASQLRGQSGAGSGNTIDTTGVTRGPIGDAGGTDFRVAQSFQVTAAGKLSQFTVFADTTAGSPSGTINWSIQTNGATIPSGVSLVSGTIAGGSWTASANNTITVTGGPFLDVSTTYWLVLEMSAMQATNTAYSVRYNTAGGYASGLFKWDTTTGASFPGTWAGGGGAKDMRCTVTTSALVTTDLLAQGVGHTAADIVVSSVKLWLKKTGTPAGTLTCAIYDDSGGSPNAVITNGTAGTIAASTLSTSYGYIEFLFPVAARPTLTASTQYHVVLSTSDSASNANYVEWGSDNTSPSYANGQLKTSISSVWAATSPASDGCFEVYAQTTLHYEEMPKALFTGGSGGCGVWYGDAAGANTDTVTRVINNTGSGKEIVIDIVIPVQ